MIEICERCGNWEGMQGNYCFLCNEDISYPEVKIRTEVKIPMKDSNEYPQNTTTMTRCFCSSCISILQGAMTPIAAARIKGLEDKLKESYDWSRKRGEERNKEIRDIESKLQDEITTLKAELADLETVKRVINEAAHE